SRCAGGVPLGCAAPLSPFASDSSLGWSSRWDVGGRASPVWRPFVAAPLAVISTCCSVPGGARSTQHHHLHLSAPPPAALHTGHTTSALRSTRQWRSR